MNKFKQMLVVCGLLVSAACAGAGQQFATIKNFQLSSGGVIEQCKIGYRTYGKLNDDKSNVVIFPTWFGGTTADFENYKKVGPGAFADSDRYYVITIDALGNGVSCSPSNTGLKNGAPFDQISTADMVQSQYELLTRHLGINSVHAVIGFSMGGMQGFRWLEMYPDFMEKVVIVDGSPRATSFDLLQWQTHKEIGLALKEGGFDDAAIGSVISRVTYLTLFTPGYFVETVPAEELDEYLAPTFKPDPAFNIDNYVSQLDAIISHSVIGSDSDSLQRFADGIRAEVLIIGAPSDHMVNQVPAQKLASHIGADYLSIDSNCGHIGSSCEQVLVNERVAKFLGE